MGVLTMKDVMRVVRKDLYSFIHNLKAVIFSLVVLLLSLGLLSGVSLGKSSLSNVSIGEEEKTSLREYYKSQAEIYGYYVDKIDGKEAACPTSICAAPDPSLREYYLVQGELYRYLLDNGLYLYSTAFLLSSSDEPLYDEFGENYHLVGTSDYKAVTSLASSLYSVYFSLFFSIAIGFILFHGKGVKASTKNERNSPITPRRFYEGRLLSAFTLVTLSNLAFFILSAALGGGFAFAPLFLAYSYGRWISVSSFSLALCYFLVNELMSFLILCIYGLFKTKEVKKRFIPILVVGGGSLLSIGLGYLTSSLLKGDAISFYFFPVLNLARIPYAFYNWSFLIVAPLYLLAGLACFFLSRRKSEMSFENFGIKRERESRS